MKKKTTGRTIAIGDIHGCATTLFALLEKLAISTDDQLIFLGDYIDRGPDSKGVIICLLALIENGYNIITLRGNHEQLFMDSEYGFLAFNDFVQNGGDKTLENLGTDFFHELPQRFQDFFRNTLHYYETATHIFVHAGLNFDNDNILEDLEAMLWRDTLIIINPSLVIKNYCMAIRLYRSKQYFHKQAIALILIMAVSI